MSRPPVGSLEWERCGSPALSLPQRWTLRHRCGHPLRPPRRIDLEAWTPPPAEAVRYFFTAIRYELSGSPVGLDREALCVAALLHDTGLFDAARQDAVALAITTNLNPFVSLDRYGPVAHYLQAGGLVDVLAQQWRVHPDNLADILDRYPRDGFAQDTARLVRQEARRNPGCRFACCGPIFPTAVRWSSFTTP